MQGFSVFKLNSINETTPVLNRYINSQQLPFSTEERKAKVKSTRTAPPLLLEVVVVLLRQLLLPPAFLASPPPPPRSVTSGPGSVARGGLPFLRPASLPGARLPFLPLAAPPLLLLLLLLLLPSLPLPLAAGVPGALAPSLDEADQLVDVPRLLPSC